MNESFDVWFARDERGDLYVSVCAPDEPPTADPIRVGSVGRVLRWLKKEGCVIAQVGIADIEMLRI